MNEDIRKYVKNKKRCLTQNVADTFGLSLIEAYSLLKELDDIGLIGHRGKLPGETMMESTIRQITWVSKER